MRIIGGSARSLRLAAPRSGTRPTSDRVREAMFSALEARDAIDGSRVLDLYAGSGALGLEAVSRGASSAVLVERNAAAAGIARRNVQTVLAATGAGPDVRVVTQSVLSYLRAEPGEADLVFADPPYDLGAGELDQVLEIAGDRLSPDGLLILERSARSADPVLPAGLELAQRKDYGQTAVWWFRPVSR